MRVVCLALIFCSTMVWANSAPEPAAKKEEAAPAEAAAPPESLCKEGCSNGEIQESHRDIDIPKSLVGKIEKLYVKSYREMDPYSTKTDSELVLNIPRRLFPVQVLLKEKTKGVLKENTLYNMPNGGGVINLKEILTGRKGTFFAKFALNYKLEGNQQSTPKLTVYFISRHKKRMLDGKMVGLGCDKYVEITKDFQKENSGSGYKINTTDGRHITLLGGTFVFVVPEQDALHIAVVQFQDSGRPDLTCSKE